MELKSRILTTVYAPFTAEAAGTVIGVQRAEGALCSLASVQWGGITVWQAAGAISHDGQELTEPLLSCPVPETPGRVPWRPPGDIKNSM